MESSEWAKGEPGESYLRKESTILSAGLSGDRKSQKIVLGR